MIKKVIHLFFVLTLILPVATNQRSIKIKQDLTIGGEDSDLVFYTYSADVDEDGNIYIADLKGYCISKFSSKGDFIKKTGSRGEGPGDFPGELDMIRYSAGKLYITIKNRPHFFIFDKELNFLFYKKFSYPILDFIILKNRIFVLSPSLQESFPIVTSDVNGNFPERFDKNQLFPKEVWENYGSFAIDPDGNCILARRYEDSVELWSKSSERIWSTHLLAGQKLQLIKKNSGLYPDTKKCFCYRDVEIDRFGNIYILGGAQSKNVLRDVYVISKTGKPIGAFTLPHDTHFILIDSQNNLYSKGPFGSLIRNKIIIE